MGNQLVALAPSQIYPVEHYIQDIPEHVQFETSLGSTRFFKVAQCTSDTGPVVVKVFAIHDPSHSVKSYQERLLELRRILTPTFNCLPYTRAILTDKAGFIIRQYGKYSLYDRISTRPFLSTVEKRWLTFQLLLAVDQVHKLGVCHGDIKLENIMVSSWSWLMLTDFASFKPTFLPEDNPADFSYFFDTSRRRTCYIAPERFVSRGVVVESVTSSGSSQIEEGGDKMEHKEGGGEDLLPAMDMFSVGCCIGELFTDGSPPFDFSQLLAYRAGEFYPVEFLAKIEDKDARELVEHMINKDPSMRHSVGEYLAQERGKVFPEYFYSFLQSYMGMFSRAPLMSSDQKIRRIHKDLTHFQALLESSDPTQAIQVGCLLVVTSVVTSCVRSLALTSSQLQCLAILEWLATHQPSEVILERILPHVIYYFSSQVPCVRVRAVHALVTSLASVTMVPRSDANTFPEYILPSLLPLCQDPSVNVRAALAFHLATIAELSTSFLDMVTSEAGEGEVGTSYDTEVTALHELVAQMVTLLLEDNSNCVKQVVVSKGAARLAVFFGRQRANDVLLSHMITFLNDKEDGQLRHCFYDNIAGVASFVGWQCSPILKPLLEQGLGDQEELVVARAITAMSDLAVQGLLEKVAIFDMMRVTAPFLLHSNLWVRQATAGLVAALASRLDTVDVQVKVGSLVAPFLRQPMVQVDKPALLLAHLKEPVPRPVLEQVIKFGDTMGLLAVLEERQTARRLVRGTGQQVTYPDLSPQLRQLFGRLAEAGMLPGVEDQILGLREYVTKVARFRSNTREQVGIIDCGLMPADKRTERLMLEGPRRAESGDLVSDWQTTSEGGGREGDTQPLVAPSRAALSRLVGEKRAEFASLAARQENVVVGSVVGWRPRGQLVAHLAEHKAGVTRLASIPDTTLLASTSTDGTLRIWDCAKMEGRNMANKARQVYNRHTPLDSVAASCHSHTLATAARDGSVTVFNIEKQSMVASRNIDLDEEGSPIELVFCDLNTSPLLFYSTAFGSIVGWDLRKPGNAVKFSQELKQGLTTAMCVAGEESWLAAGTSSGVVGVWDLRFKLQVASLIHPARARVRRLVGGSKPGQLLVSVQGNNEVGIWSVESGSRQQAVWASSAPPLAISHPSQHSVCCMTMAGAGLITGGTDCKVRYWHLTHPQESSVVGADYTHTVRSRLVEGTEVFVEGGRGRGAREEGGRIQADIQHTDWVTDMAVCQTTQSLLVTASNDGVIKVWK